jgi:glycosyltransferase involved in cell wall biosynthesis
MSACDALLLTSYHEGSPTVVKEALACGLPIVSVDVGDVREQVHGVRGCLVVPRDPEQIAEALRSVFYLDGRRLELSDTKLRSLDEARAVDKVVEVYRSAIARTCRE